MALFQALRAPAHAKPAEGLEITMAASGGRGNTAVSLTAGREFLVHDLGLLLQVTADGHFHPAYVLGS